MGFLDKVMGKKSSKNVVLTELGKQKAEQVAGEGGARLKIASDLDQYGESSLREISERTGISEQKVKIWVDKLCDDGWCRNVYNSGG